MHHALQELKAQGKVAGVSLQGTPEIWHWLWADEFIIPPRTLHILWPPASLAVGQIAAHRPDTQTTVMLTYAVV